MSRRRTCFAVLLLLISVVPVRARDVDRAALDSLFSDALKKWNIPGLSVVIVQGDETIYLKSFGVREAGKEAAMTPDTVFGIGSLTKAFTATTLGVLVDDGKAKWDDPVRKHVPYFHLSDPLADRDVTLRDLLCHRTGLARHDMLWYRAPWTPEESVRRLAYLEPSTSFRSTYEYCNLTYLAAGFAISGAAGEPWPDVMRKRLFEPMGMKRVVFTRSDAAKLEPATPHHRGADGKFTPIEWYPDDEQVRASGSIKTSARELAAWLRLQLNGGSIGGKQVVSATTLRETHMPQAVVPLESIRARLAGTTQQSYGLGWHIGDYRGQPLLEHGGAVDGFRTRILLLPKQNLGAVLLINCEETGFLTATGNQLVEKLLNLEPKEEWQRHYLALAESAAKAKNDRAARLEKARRPNTTPSHELKAYVGIYEDAAYGKATVTVGDGVLGLSWSSWKVELRHYHFDTFEVRDPGRLDVELVTFALNGDGTVGTLRFLGREFKRTK
jgi:CubicO group peptidase (beta-lactamase class C family)